MTVFSNGKRAYFWSQFIGSRKYFFSEEKVLNFDLYTDFNRSFGGKWVLLSSELQFLSLCQIFEL